MEGISQAVVVVRKDETGRQLICAFYTETKPVPVEQIKSALREKLPRYMTPHVFTRLDALPMTPSGKIDRKALPKVDFTALQSEVEYVAPETPEETALTNAIQTVLSVERVGLLDNFFDLGGDSLKAIELIAKLERAGLRTDTKTIFACETVKELAAALVPATSAEEEPIPDGDIPATAAQLRVYTAQNMQGGTAYNVPYAFKVQSVDPERLQAAVSALIDRHEILCTHFENRDGEIMQVAEDSVPFTLERLESDDISAFVRPFDLSKAPLLRVGYFENTVMVDLHHIITDGGSMPVFLRELNELYMGRKLTETPTQYRAFAAQRQDMTAHEDYWLSVYREELPELALNTDFKRGQKQSYSYLLCCADRKTNQCWPSYQAIGRATHMSKNTVRKYVCTLVDRGLIATEETEVITKDGLKRNGNLKYTILPIQDVVERFYQRQLDNEGRLPEKHKAEGKWGPRRNPAYAEFSRSPLGKGGSCSTCCINQPTQRQPVLYSRRRNQFARPWKSMRQRTVLSPLPGQTPSPFWRGRPCAILPPIHTGRKTESGGYFDSGPGQTLPA